MTGARKNNLKGVDVKFPLNVMTVVTGVSGSGKSSLVRDIFYEGVKRHLDDAARLTVDLLRYQWRFEYDSGDRVRRSELDWKEFSLEPRDVYRCLRRDP